MSNAVHFNKSKKRSLIIALLAATAIAHPSLAFAQVKAANNATNVYTAPNGVPVVDIANPNSAGLSHNQFLDYSVGSNGLVLNNGDSSQIQRQSQLAGAVSANLNLSHSASVILNEVVSTNRSTLAGYTEVLGTSADVIVANPNGITCSGCGFINTSHVSLTTGNPIISGAGALTGFAVDNGDILITGQGIDGSKQDYLGLFARSIALQGQVNAKQLDIVAGANDIDYATKAVTARAAGGAAPTLAIDSSALGGMYADRIRLVATEAGVGVRMLGDAAAGVGDFTLDGAGQIEVGSHVSAKNGNVKITSTTTGADAIKANVATISAHHDINLTALSGQVHLLGGVLTAGNDVSIDSDTLIDESTADAITDNNKRYAGGALSLTQTGVATIGGGTTWGANGALSLSADSLTINAGAAIESVTGGVSLTAGNGLSNAATISAAAGGVTVRADGTITNTGTIYSAGLLDIADGAGTGTEDVITNGGTLLGDGGITLLADVLTNNSGASLQGTTGSTITVNTLSNSGTLIASANAANSATITAGSITNTATGILQSAMDLTLTVTDSIANSFKILATGALSLIAGNSGTTLAVTNNTGGILQAGGTLTVAGTSGGHNASIGTQNGTLLGNNVSLTLSSLTNSNIIQATNGLTLSDSGSATNNSGGKLLADGSFTLGVTNTLTNSGAIQQGGGGAITAGTVTINSGGLINLATNALSSGTITAMTLTDNGGLQSAGGMTLNVSGTLTDGSGIKILAGKNLTISAGTLTLGNSSSAIIAGQSGSGTGSITVSNAFTNIGALYSGGDLTVSAPGIFNNATGGIAAAGTLHAYATTGVFYNYGALYAGTLLDARAVNSTFNNQDTGTMDGGTDISITANTFINNNNIDASRNLTISATYFYNEVTGGDQRTWHFGTATTTNTGWSSDPDWLIWGESADDYYTKKWTDYQTYTVAPTHQPRLVAGNTLSISNFYYALNLGSIISANTVNISSSVGGASFTNDDYSLISRAYTETWYNHVSCCSDVIYLDYSYGLGDTTSHTDTSTIYGGGIYSNTLNASGFSLTNTSSPYTASVQSTSASGTAAGAASGTSSTGGASSVSFGGITITLPTNPNGFFVVSKDPNSKYLIETNPMYSVGSSFLGSDYMLTTYGVDPDEIERRLGDANYEASLIRDQLLNQGAASLLNGSTDEASALQTLMDNGIDQGKKLGLVVGVAPTAEQLASLGSDIVWMVDVVVEGQHVLAPVVYLSAATQSQIAHGAVIESTNANLQLVSLTNTGGTISGSNTLNITTQGDITNTSGTIKGGDVSLTSTEGSIINQTVAETTGGEGNQHTNIGNTAGIQATGNLNLDAKEDITNKGANMSAGGDASLTAGNNITFDTVEDKESSATHSGSNGSLTGGTYNSTTTTTDTNLKSGLTVGGNLSTKSGNDTTFAGTDVNVGGNADINAGGDLNIIARNDSTESTTTSKSGTVLSGDSTTTHDKETTNVASNFNVGGNLNSNSGGDTTIQGSNVNVTGDGSVTAGGNLNILDGQDTSDTSTSSSHTGLGVGGGVYGTSTTTDTNTKSTSVASNINFGGNGSLNAGNDITVQGSNVSSGGDMNLDAGNDINILEGRNTETSTHTESTTTFGKIDMGEGYTPPEDEEEPEEEKGGVNAHAEASASAEEDDHGGVTFSQTDIDSTTHHTDTASGSSIKSGGNMNINAGNDVTVRGSDVEAGGDANIDANNVNILAAENIDTTTSSHTTAKTGLYGSTHNEAGAEAEANAHAQADGEGSPEASADASAGAHAGTENTVDLVRVDEESKTSTDITHTGSSIKSGGNMNVNADNKLSVNGSSLESGGDMNLSATDMSFTAANDSHTESSTDSHTRAGLYADAGTQANAGAGANAQGLSAGGEASADAGADAGVGLYGSNTTNTNSSGSTHAVTSSIKSGGNMTRTATNNITDEGTQIKAGGDFTQSSTTWDSKAAHDTEWSTSSSESNKAKLGLYAEANAGASGSASTMDGVENDSGADASVGISASYNRNTSDESSSSSHAVVSNIKSGGNMKTTTTDKTSLEGTNLASGGDMELNAGSLDYKAAQDTESSSSSKSNIDAGGKIGIDATKAVTGSLEGGYSSGDSSESSTHGVAGSMTSGGNMKINVTNDANFEGTNLDAGGDASIKAGGDVNFSAVHDTHQSSETNLDVSASISASKNKSKGSSGAGFNAEGSYDTSESSSDTATAGSIKSGGNLDISSGKSATFEGTKMEAGGDASIEAKDNVNFNAAKSTSSSSGWGVNASIGASKETEGGSTEKKGSFGLGGSYNQSSETTSDAVGIKTGGDLKVKAGNDVNLEGTNIESGGTASLDAGHDVNFKAAENTSSSIGFSAEIGGETTKTQESGQAAQTEKGGKFGLDVSGSTSTTKTGGSINAGSISIHSGNDTTLEGTQTQSAGNTSINAGGDVNLASADSSNVSGGIGGGVGSKGGGLTRLSIGGGAESQGVNMQSGGDTTITSGGKTTMEGTQITADGTATVDAAGGVDKSTTVSGGANLGLDHAGADLDVQTTTITSKNSVPPPPADFQKALAAIQNDPSLTQAQKMKAMTDKIKNDPSLTQAQKDKLLADLAKANAGH